MSDSMAINTLMNIATVSSASMPDGREGIAIRFLSWLAASVQHVASDGGSVDSLPQQPSGQAQHGIATYSGVVTPTTSDLLPATVTGDTVYGLMEEPTGVGEKIAITESAVPSSCQHTPARMTVKKANTLQVEAPTGQDAVAVAPPTLPLPENSPTQRSTSANQEITDVASTLVLPPFILIPPILQPTTPPVSQVKATTDQVAITTPDCTQADAVNMKGSPSLNSLQPAMDLVQTSWGMEHQADRQRFGMLTPGGMLGMSLLLGQAIKEGRRAVDDTSGQWDVPSPINTADSFSQQDASSDMPSALPRVTTEVVPLLLSSVPRVKSQPITSTGVDNVEGTASTEELGLQVAELAGGTPEQKPQSMPRVHMTSSDIPFDGMTFTVAPNDDVLPQHNRIVKDRTRSTNSSGDVTEFAGVPGEMTSVPITTQQPQSVRMEQNLPTVSMPLVARQVIAQIASAVRRSAREEQQEIIIRLDPPELGALRLEVTRQTTGELTAHIAATNAVSRDLLTTRLPELRQTLQDAGLNIGQCSVSLDMQNQQGWQQPRQELANQQVSHPQPSSAVEQRIIRPERVITVGSLSGDRAVDYFA